MRGTAGHDVLTEHEPGHAAQGAALGESLLGIAPIEEVVIGLAPAKGVPEIQLTLLFCGMSPNSCMWMLALSLIGEASCFATG